MTHVQYLAEKREIKNGEFSGWVPTEDRVGECELMFDEASGTYACLKVVRPTSDYRYSIVYKLGSSGTAKERNDLVAGEMIKILYDRHGGQIEKIRKKLSATVAGITEAILLTSSPDFKKETLIKLIQAQEQSGYGLETSWRCFLWRAEERKLVPVFGEFQMAGWSDSFAAGNGVAGHAFRFRNPVALYTEALCGRTRSLIDRPGNAGGRWVLGIPLLVAEGGPAAGVICFDGQESEGTPIARKLHDLAAELCKPNPNEDATKKKADLLNYLSKSFWHGAEWTFYERGQPYFAAQAQKLAKNFGSAS